MKTKKKQKNLYIFLGIGLLIIVFLAVIIYNNKDFLTGIGRNSDLTMPELSGSHNPPCLAGEQSVDSKGGATCFKPSGYEGKACNRKQDCGTGGCRFENRTVTGPAGKCDDIPFGCNKWIDDKGAVEGEICVD
jgi:hypothetical protein